MTALSKEQVISIACAGAKSYAITGDGKLFEWGGKGERSTWSFFTQSGLVPHAVKELAHFVTTSVAPACLHTVAYVHSGTFYLFSA